MDLATTVLLVLITVLALNQVVMRVPAARDNAFVFWGVQFVDLALGCAVLIVGLPGFEHAPAVSWVVGLLFILHLAQNLKARGESQQRKRRAEIDAAKEADRQRRRDREYAEE